MEKAESYLKQLGFRQVRARYHEQILRIEIDREAMPKILELAESVLSHLKSIGFSYVTLDLAGYRMGSANEVLNLSTEVKKR